MSPSFHSFALVTATNTEHLLWSCSSSRGDVERPRSYCALPTIIYLKISIHPHHHPLSNSKSHIQTRRSSLLDIRKTRMHTVSNHPNHLSISPPQNPFLRPTRTWVPYSLPTPSSPPAITEATLFDISVGVGVVRTFLNSYNRTPLPISLKNKNPPLTTPNTTPLGSPMYPGMVCMPRTRPFTSPRTLSPYYGGPNAPYSIPPPWKRPGDRSPFPRHGSRRPQGTRRHDSPPRGGGRHDRDFNPLRGSSSDSDSDSRSRSLPRSRNSRGRSHHAPPRRRSPGSPERRGRSGLRRGRGSRGPRGMSGASERDRWVSERDGRVFKRF